MARGSVPLHDPHLQGQVGLSWARLWHKPKARIARSTACLTISLCQVTGRTSTIRAISVTYAVVITPQAALVDSPSPPPSAPGQSGTSLPAYRLEGGPGRSLRLARLRRWTGRGVCVVRRLHSANVGPVSEDKASAVRLMTPDKTNPTRQLLSARAPATSLSPTLDTALHRQVHPSRFRGRTSRIQAMEAMLRGTRHEHLV